MSQLRDSKKRLTAVVAASKTTTTEVFGVGPVVAATVVGITGDVTRFASRDRFAAFNGTAPNRGVLRGTAGSTASRGAGTVS
ncbi:MAG TPA: transposase [Jiangellaceae bacterium]|nr:transposase [Jiangellaceae bacterium]